MKIHLIHKYEYFPAYFPTYCRMPDFQSGHSRSLQKPWMYVTENANFSFHSRKQSRERTGWPSYGNLAAPRPKDRLKQGTCHRQRWQNPGVGLESLTDHRPASTGIFAWGIIYIPFHSLIATCPAKTNTLLHRHTSFECFLLFLSAICLLWDRAFLFACLSPHGCFLHHHHHQFKHQAAFQVDWEIAPVTILH